MSKRIIRKNVYLSVKDPFLKYINHGSALKGEKRLNRLVVKLKEFIRFVSRNEYE